MLHWGKGSNRWWDDAGGVGVDAGLGKFTCANVLI